MEAIRSRYAVSIIESVKKRCPSKLAEFNQILERIDQQGVENYKFFYPDNFPGVRIPYTNISIGEHNSKQQNLSIIFQPWCLPPAGHPFDLWGEVYDRVSKSLNKKHSSHQIYAFGLPHGFSGIVTPDWIENLRKDQYKSYGKVYASLIQTKILPKNINNTSLTLFGISQGGLLADQTARHLNKIDGLKKQLFLYIPTGLHQSKQNFYKAIQIPLGFLGEVGFRHLLDRNFQKETKMESIFLEKMQNRLENLGIDFSQEHSPLKQTAGKIDGLNLLKGYELSSEIKSFVLRGSYDPVNSNPFLAIRALIDHNVPLRVVKKGNSTEFFVHTSHYINYNEYRINSWVRELNKSHLLLSQAMPS